MADIVIRVMIVEEAHLKRSSEVARRQLGERLRVWRAQSGHTQRQVASLLGYSTPQFVSNWERGLSLPPVSHLPLLCEVLRVPPGEMIDAMIEYERTVRELEVEKVRALFPDWGEASPRKGADEGEISTTRKVGR